MKVLSKWTGQEFAASIDGDRTPALRVNGRHVDPFTLGAAFVILSATEEERDTLRLAGYFVPRLPRREG